MAKRFIDTGFLDQKWIRKLTPERKSFLIYLMLKCNNGGIIELDMEDAEFWVGKKIGDFAQFLPENYLIPINDNGKYFMPKFIEWQYGDLSSNKNIVVQARQILDKHGLINTDFTLNLDNIYITFTKDLPESQVTGNSKDNSNSKGKDKEGEKKTINYPWDDERFIEVWDLWKQYKKEQFKFIYKPIGEKGALSELSELSKGELTTALLIIKQSIQKGWKGFFELQGDFKNKDKEYDIEYIYQNL